MTNHANYPFGLELDKNGKLILSLVRGMNLQRLFEAPMISNVRTCLTQLYTAVDAGLITAEEKATVENAMCDLIAVLGATNEGRVATVGQLCRQMRRDWPDGVEASSQAAYSAGFMSPHIQIPDDEAFKGDIREFFETDNLLAHLGEATMREFFCSKARWFSDHELELISRAKSLGLIWCIKGDLNAAAVTTEGAIKNGKCCKILNGVHSCVAGSDDDYCDIVDLECVAVSDLCL